MDHSKLLEDLLNGKNKDDIERILELLINEYGERIKKLPVGGRDNNLGHIEIGSDPGKGVVERLTNAIDGVLEFEHDRHGGIPLCRTPQEGATAWLAVPARGLYQLSASRRLELAQSICLTLEEADDPLHMNIVIEDNGIGIPHEKMRSTILSLGESNKLQKPYLIGAFGQGGSSTFAHCKYSIICSGLNSKASKKDISFTIVFLEDLPPEQYKHGRYVYLTLDNELFKASISNDRLRYATTVKHYYYDLSAYKSKFGQSSVYGLLQRALFDPILPIFLNDKVHNLRRTIKGARNAFNSAADEEVDERGPDLIYSLPRYNILLEDYGSIGLEYWVLKERPKKKSYDAIKAYVDEKHPILFTLNGQTHAEFSSNLISSMAELPFLRNRIVVHIDCNNLSPLAKRNLFSSTREDIRKNYISKKILDEIIKSLRSDDELKLINDEARNSILNKNTGSEHELQREIVKLLRFHGYETTIPFGGMVTVEAKGTMHTVPVQKKSRVIPTRVIELHDPPTYLKVLNQSPIEFYAEQRKYLRLETDATSNYHDAENFANSKFNIVVNGKSVKCSGTTPLKDGRMRILLDCNQAALEGEKGECIVELHRFGQESLKEIIEYKVIQVPLTKESNKKIAVPKINPPIPINGPEDANWSEQNWSEDINAVASSSVLSNGELIVYYSTVFPQYKQRYEQISHSNPLALETFVKQYEIQLILHSILLDGNKINALDTEDLEEWEQQERCRFAILSCINAERYVNSGMIITE